MTNETTFELAQIKRRVRMARAYAAEQMPYFSPALFSARLVLTAACPSLAAVDDGMRVYFNPKMVSEMLEGESPQQGLAQLAWVWLHEISHVLREHGSRCRERCAESLLWNMAADLEINDSEWADLIPPRRFPPLLPHLYAFPAGKLAEFYYDRLKAAKDNNEFSLDLEWNEGDRFPAGVAFDEGSGVHDSKRPWELPDDNEENPSVSPLEQATIRQRVAEGIQKSCGTGAGGWYRWAEETLKPKVNWRQRLRRRVRGAMVMGVGNRLDYTYQRPHRRSQVYAPVICPSLGGDLLPRVTCIVDTSASMSERELSQSLAEVRGVLESLHAPVTVIPCDAVAYDPIDVLTSSDFLHLRKNLRGGGGTDMVEGIQAALEMSPSPDAIIVLTDGWTPYPRQPYKTPVIFGILNPRTHRDVPKPPIPPWKREDVIVIS